MNSVTAARASLKGEVTNGSRTASITAIWITQTACRRRDSQRRPQEAAEAFQQSIQLHPLDWKSHHELGAIERVLGHAELAAKHAELGARGKQLEREFMELLNATQADAVLLEKLLVFAKDCGDQDVVDGLTFRLQASGSPAPAGPRSLH